MKFFFRLSFLGQLKIDDFDKAHPAPASSPVFDIEDLLDLIEGVSFFHQGLYSNLFFFDALNDTQDLFLRSQVAMTVDKYLSVQVQDGPQNFDQTERVSIFVPVDERVSSDKDEVTDKSYLFIGKIDDSITIRVRRAEIKKIDARASWGAAKIEAESL